MKRLLYVMWSKFLTWFGDIKVFPRAFWLVRDPDYFKMTGQKIIDVMNIIKPGDIIIRGFDHYLDGKFIPSKAGWSHGALYVGDNQIIHAVAEGVSTIHIIDFCECDRIAILRPRKGVRKALKRAQKFLLDKVPYDFGFVKNVSALYCFELCGECYSELNIPLKSASRFFGLVRRDDIYLAESFFDSPDFICVFECNDRNAK